MNELVLMTTFTWPDAAVVIAIELGAVYLLGKIIDNKKK